MTHQTNPFGHAALVLSHCDYSKGGDARIEIAAGIGLYSTVFPFFGFAPFAEGHVKIEKESALMGPGMRHKTWRISLEQQAILLNEINKDRALPHNKKTKYHPQTNKPLDNPGGPYFNALTNSCKTYALKKLRAIDIDVSSLHKLSTNMGIFSGKLNPFETEVIDNKTLWKSPLSLDMHLEKDPLNNPEANLRHLIELKQFEAILDSLDTTTKLLDAKIKQLTAQSPCTFLKAINTSIGERFHKNTLSAFEKMLSELNNLHKYLLLEGKYPYRIHKRFIDKSFHTLEKITQQGHKEIVAFGYSPRWIEPIIDSLKNLLITIQSYFTSHPSSYILSIEGTLQKVENYAKKR